MKILLHQWNSLLHKDIIELFQEEHVSYDLLPWDFHACGEENVFEAHVSQNLELAQYDLLFSINYWPHLSTVCQKHGIPYVAWCYDAPLETENIAETLGNEVNRVYCFDRMQAAEYHSMGFHTVHHMPLGIHARRLARIDATSTNCDPYRASVSFVGKLYGSVADWILLHSNEYCRGYLEGLIHSQRELYGANIITPSLTDDFLNLMNDTFDWPETSTKNPIKREQLAFAVNCEATRRDRIILLSLCGKRYPTRLYTYDTSFSLQNVEKMPPVDYYHQMPYVFAASKINLNITLRSIQTGIPLRALDIMGCGGFLLSNFQTELAESFAPGADLALYDSVEDFLDKLSFYLEHEELRSKVAQNGRTKTLEQFDMKDRLAIMLRMD